MAYKNIEDRRAYDRAYYRRRTAEQKQTIKESKRKRRIRNRQFLYNYLLSHPCKECGFANVAALQFHHRNPADKKCAVSLMNENSIEAIVEEISKCDVLCANCHAIKSREQLGWYKDLEN